MSDTDMTQVEQTIADAKVRAEIDKLSAEIAKVSAEIPKIAAETIKLNKEVRHVTVMTFVAPFATAAAIMAATATLVKIFFA